ncbi:MAG: elongation factor 1-beta [Thaumarchaeota archaeon]|nr:elongation factor 1-beta [Nitrososphaerota archaeon]
MARVAMLLRIMPADQDVDLNNLIQKIKEGLPSGFELRDAKIKPFAFGMSVIEAMFTLPEEEGASARLEEYLRGFEDIQEINVLMSTRL